MDVAGFDVDSPSVLCSSIGNNFIVQVTHSGARLIDGVTAELVDVWKPKEGASIAMGAAEGSQLLLATSGSMLYLLDTARCPGKWSLTTAVRMEHEVACVAICSAHWGVAEESDSDGLPARMHTASVARIASAPSIPALAAVGLWTDLTIRLLSLPTLAAVHTEVSLWACSPTHRARRWSLADTLDPRCVCKRVIADWQALTGSVIPRSLAFAPLCGVIYLLCALGDGQLMTYVVSEVASQPETRGMDNATRDVGIAADVSDPPLGGSSACGSEWALGQRKVVTLGTKPISLTTFRSHGALHVFAASDRPTVIHAANGARGYSPQRSPPNEPPNEPPSEPPNEQPSQRAPSQRAALPTSSPPTAPL